MIRMDIKQWYEQNHLQIEQGYNTIAQKAVIGFQQHFSKKPIFTCTMETNPVASEYENIRGISIESEITVDGINKLSQAGGAVALATVVGIATGGIGLPVIFAASGGMMLGQKFAGGYFSGKEVKRQKEELSRKLPEIVEDVFNKISNTMSDHYQGMFEQFKESLSTEYENVVIELNSGIEDKIAQYQSNRASIDMMCKRYTQIAQQVYQLKE